MGALNDSIHVLKQIQKHPEDERQILETLDMVWGLPLCHLFAWWEEGEMESWTIFWWHYFGGSLLVVVLGMMFHAKFVQFHLKNLLL